MHGPTGRPMHMRIMASSFCSGLVLLSLSACGLTPSTVNAPASPMSSVTSTQGHQREVLVVAPFADARPSDLCGEKEILGIRAAHLTCGTNPGRWIAEAIKKSFADNGYVVLPDGSRPGATTTVVHGTVTHLYMTTPTEFSKAVNRLDIAVRLDVTLPTGRSFGVEASGQSPWKTDGNNGYDEAATSATMQIASESVESAGELLERGELAPGWHPPPLVAATAVSERAADGGPNAAPNASESAQK